MGSSIEPDRYPDTGFSVKDTSPEINAEIFKRTMALTNTERFLMGMSMMTTARAIVWANLPPELKGFERKKAFYERFYGESLPDDFPKNDDTSSFE